MKKKNNTTINDNITLDTAAILLNSSLNNGSGMAPGVQGMPAGIPPIIIPTFNTDESEDKLGR